MVGTGGRAPDGALETGTIVMFAAELEELLSALEVMGTETYSGGVEVSAAEDDCGIEVCVGSEHSGNCAEPATVIPIIPGIQESEGRALSVE